MATKHTQISDTEYIDLKVGTMTVIGTPIDWTEKNGEIKRAMQAYLNMMATPRQINLTITYLQYHINAPCWLEKTHFLLDEDSIEAIQFLREMAMKMETVRDIDAYIEEATRVGVDPLFHGGN